MKASASTLFTAKNVELLGLYPILKAMKLDSLWIAGFHLLMPFMGAVGKIMAGSGIEELWSTVRAPSSVPHMSTGHAFSRALRAHFLTQEALATIILKSSNILDA